MWDLPRPGIEPMSPALAGRFLTTVPPGKSPGWLLITEAWEPLPGFRPLWPGPPCSSTQISLSEHRQFLHHALCTHSPRTGGSQGQTDLGRAWGLRTWGGTRRGAGKPAVWGRPSSWHQTFYFLVSGLQIPLDWLSQTMESGHRQMPGSQRITGAGRKEKNFLCSGEGKGRMGVSKVEGGWVLCRETLSGRLLERMGHV